MVHAALTGVQVFSRRAGLDEKKAPSKLLEAERWKAGRSSAAPTFSSLGHFATKAPAG